MVNEGFYKAMVVYLADHWSYPFKIIIYFINCNAFYPFKKATCHSTVNCKLSSVNHLPNNAKSENQNWKIERGPPFTQKFLSS